VSADPARNKRRPAPVVEAPADPVAPEGELSPPPGPTASTIRPLASRPRRKAWSLLSMTAGALLVLACSVGVAWGARRYVLASPRFAIRAVLVDGGSRRSAEEIAAIGGISVGSNVFALDLEASKDALVADPWIAKAIVARKLPGTVEVHVVEHEARAVVSIDRELYLSSPDGELFKRLDSADPIDLPLVTGVARDSVVIDREGVAVTVRTALDVLTELERSGLARRYPVQELHVEKDGSIVATIGKDAIALALGRAPFRGKIDQAARVLAEVTARKAQASVVFLDNDAHPERVVVRMR
jgi:cell division protein FtsQ